MSAEVLCGRGPIASGLDKLPRAVDWQKHNMEGWGSSVSKLGSKSYRWLYINAGAWGREMAPVSFFISGGAHQ